MPANSTHLDCQDDAKYRAYKNRTFNASARTGDGFVGLIFRRDLPFKLPECLRTATSGGVVKAECRGKTLNFWWPKPSPCAGDGQETNKNINSTMSQD